MLINNIQIQDPTIAVGEMEKDVNQKLKDIKKNAPQELKNEFEQDKDRVFFEYLALGIALFTVILVIFLSAQKGGFYISTVFYIAYFVLAIGIGLMYWFKKFKLCRYILLVV